MTREIKFRAKVKHHDPMTNPKNGWVEGYYFQDLTQGEMRSYIFQPPCSWEVIPETIGQFTGLFDKEGKEIYEGDILVWDENGYKSPPLIVIFKFGSFGYIYIEDWFHSFAGNVNFTFNPLNTDVRFEIIGNIHDNPEIMKGGAE